MSTQPSSSPIPLPFDVIPEVLEFIDLRWSMNPLSGQRSSPAMEDFYCELTSLDETFRDGIASASYLWAPGSKQRLVAYKLLKAATKDPSRRSLLQRRLAYEPQTPLWVTGPALSALLNLSLEQTPASDPSSAVDVEDDVRDPHALRYHVEVDDAEECPEGLLATLGPHLRALSLEANEETELNAEEFRTFSHIEKLELSSAGSVLTKFPDLGRLTELALVSTLSDKPEALLELARMPLLRSLRIDSCFLSSRPTEIQVAATALQGMIRSNAVVDEYGRSSALRQLKLQRMSRINDAAIAALMLAFPEITELVLSSLNCGFTGATTCGTFQQLKFLERLQLFDNAGFDDFEAYSQLRLPASLTALEIRLSKPEASMAALDSLSLHSHCNIQSLHLEGWFSTEHTPIPGTFAKHSFGLALRSLSLPACPSFTDRSLRGIAALRELRELDLSQNRIHFDGEGLQHLDGLQKLEKINLGGCTNLDDRNMMHLANLGRSLKWLSLRHCPLHAPHFLDDDDELMAATVNTASAISRLLKLEYLDVCMSALDGNSKRLLDVVMPVVSLRHLVTRPLDSNTLRAVDEALPHLGAVEFA